METIIFITFVVGILGYLIYTTIILKNRKKDIGGPIDPGNGAGSLDEVEQINKTKIED